MTTNDGAPGAALGPLAQLCEALRATRKRLNKAALVAGTLQALGERDLVLACRYLTARPFAAFDPRQLRLGPQAVFAALRLCKPAVPLEQLRRQLVELGDLPSLAQSVLQDSAANGLTLSACHEAFCSMAQASLTPKERHAALAALLNKASASEASLLVGIATSELRLGLSTDALLDALARWQQRPLGELARLLMLTGDIGEVALLLHRGVAEAPLRRFHGLGCMLASPFDVSGPEAIELEAYVAQDKYDGIRAQVHIGDEPQAESALGGPRFGVCVPTARGPRRLVVFSRTHDDLTQSFPDIWQPLLQACESLCHIVLDGELLAMHNDKPMPFLRLQARLGRKAPSEALQQQVPVTYVAFDVLAQDDALCIDWPWSQREAALREGVAPSERVQVAASTSVHSSDALQHAFDAARARGHEGLVLKDKTSAYTPGKRGRQWRKVKLPQASFDVVVVSCEVGFGRKRHWLSDLTFAVRKSETDATLCTIGKAYSGLTDKDLEQLTPWFEAHTTEVLAHGKVRLVQPNVVLEVACDRVQASKRHKSGFALRFARIVRVRRDKDVADIDTLDAVAAAAKQHEL